MAPRPEYGLTVPWCSPTVARALSLTAGERRRFALRAESPCAQLGLPLLLVRDASLTLEALWVTACFDEARNFFEFFATAAGGDVDGTSALQILYAVGGERDVAERELPHLAGYAGSRPVRAGNDAWRQTQLDVYGELLSGRLPAGRPGRRLRRPRRPLPGRRGLPGEEGTFATCNFWLVQCLALLGDVERACELFRTAPGAANDPGLFAEEIGPDGEALGNFPQAFTNVGLVNATWAITRAQEQRGTTAP